MTDNVTAHPWLASLAWSAAVRAGGLCLLGFSGWLWFSATDDPAWKALTLVAALAVAALVGGTWCLSRARAEQRWREALDRYAEQEQAKRPYPRRGLAALRVGLGTGGERRHVAR